MLKVWFLQRYFSNLKIWFQSHVCNLWCDNMSALQTMCRGRTFPLSVCKRLTSIRAPLPLSKTRFALTVAPGFHGRKAARLCDLQFQKPPRASASHLLSQGGMEIPGRGHVFPINKANLPWGDTNFANYGHPLNGCTTIGCASARVYHQLVL